MGQSGGLHKRHRFPLDFPSNAVRIYQPEVVHQYASLRNRESGGRFLCTSNVSSSFCHPATVMEEKWLELCGASLPKLGGGVSFCFFGFGTHTLHWKASLAARKSSTTWARSSRWSSLSRQDDFPLNQRSQETPQEMSSRMGANDVLFVDVGDVTLWASVLG